jgi:hypothetical protein
LQTEQPDIVEQLSEFLERSRRLHAERGLLPDLVGNGNLVLDNNGLMRMIDGQPIAGEFIDAQSRVLSGLGTMSAALALA